MSRQPSPLDFPQSPLSRAFEQPLFLGLFLPVQSGGWSPSALPRSTTWTFDYNRQLTLRAEELGFDLVFALAEWLGKGGYGGEPKNTVAAKPTSEDVLTCCFIS